MKNVKYLVMAAVLLLLAACGEMAQPELEQPLTTLDDGLVTDNANAMLTSIQFGNVCKDSAAIRSVRLYGLTSNRPNGKTPPFSGNNIWKNNATLSAAANVSNAAFSTTLGNLALDSTWQNHSNGVRSMNRVEPVITFNAGSSTGAVSGTITYTLSGSDSLSPSGTLSKSVPITVSANVISCNEAPVINIQQPLSFEGDSLGGWTFSSFSLIGTASDAEDGAPDVACTPAVGKVLDVGSNNISCTATDRGGLTATASGTITVTDATAPVISGMPGNITEEATGPNGATASWTAPTAVDVVAGPSTVTCNPASGSTFALGTTSVTCSASDGNGNTARQSFTVIVQDATAPTLADLGPTTSPNAAGWYNSAVTNTFKAEDLVGFAAPLTNPHTFTKSSGTAEGSAATLSSGPVSDAAGNANPGINSAAFQIDLTRPAVSVTGVGSGATYTLGSVPAAACNTQDALSGVATHASLSSSGGPVGSVTVTCSGAVDVAGNPQAAPVSVTYSVVYAFTGFFQPIDMNGVFNIAKAGSAVPVKFKLGGDQGLNIFAAGYPKAVTVSCSTSAPSDAIEETATATTSGLKYDALADQYNYTWKTDKSWTGCRQLQVKLIDGQTYTANFKFTK